MHKSCWLFIENASNRSKYQNCRCLQPASASFVEAGGENGRRRHKPNDTRLMR